MTHTELYDSALAPTRRLLDDDPRLRVLVDRATPPALLHRFLIEYCARAVAMTQPVDGWIRRAGERCVRVGLPEIGQLLASHAKHEEGHHLMLIADTASLIKLWNAGHAAALDAERLIGQPASPATRAYIQLHEDTIAGERPFGQVAIELEIEALSVHFGPPLLANCKAVVGDAVVAQLSFATEHVALDVGHTALNRRMLDRVLHSRPDAVDALIEVGRRALLIYIQFLGECLDHARQDVPRS